MLTGSDTGGGGGGDIHKLSIKMNGKETTYYAKCIQL